MGFSHHQVEEAPTRRLSRAQRTAIMCRVDVPLAWPYAAQRQPRKVSLARPGRLRAMAAGMLFALVLLVIASAMLALR